MSNKTINGGKQSSATAKREQFRSALNRARFDKAIGEMADRGFASKSSGVRAAYDEANMRASNAWKSEFQQALAQADFDLRPKKPLTREDKRALKDFIKKLKKLLKGRPHGGDRRRPAAAERAAAYLVQERLKVLRETSGRKRISKELGTKLIAEAIERASFQLGVPSEKISPGNVERLVYKK
jgi:hypothetical protein